MKNSNPEDKIILAIDGLELKESLSLIKKCPRIKWVKTSEVSNSEELFQNPRHEYTKELLRLMPKIETIYN